MPPYLIFLPEFPAIRLPFASFSPTIPTMAFAGPTLNVHACHALTYGEPIALSDSARRIW